MAEQEKGPRQFLTKLSEEAQNALNIAGAIAPRVRNYLLEPHYYIEPLHLVIGLTEQPSVRELLVERGIDPDKMCNALIGFRPLFEADYKPQSGKDGDLSDRAVFAIQVASSFAERAGRQEISALNMVLGIIIEDREYHDNNPNYLKAMEHETKRLLGKTAGSLLESIIGSPVRKEETNGKSIVLPIPFRRHTEKEAEKEEKPDQPPEVSE